MVEGERGRDSFEVVRNFLTGLEDRAPRKDDVQRIEDDLRNVYQRLLRVRMIVPAVDLNERVWALMEMVGIRAKPAGGSMIRNAASFL